MWKRVHAGTQWLRQAYKNYRLCRQFSWCPNILAHFSYTPPYRTLCRTAPPRTVFRSVLSQKCRTVCAKNGTPQKRHFSGWRKKNGTETVRENGKKIGTENITETGTENDCHGSPSLLFSLVGHVHPVRRCGAVSDDARVQRLLRAHDGHVHPGVLQPAHLRSLGLLETLATRRHRCR